MEKNVDCLFELRIAKSAITNLFCVYPKGIAYLKGKIIFYSLLKK